MTIDCLAQLSQIILLISVIARLRLNLLLVYFRFRYNAFRCVVEPEPDHACFNYFIIIVSPHE